MIQQTTEAMQLANDVMARHIRIEQMKAYDDVAKYNANPKSVKDEDLPRVLQGAERFGYDISHGARKDTATFLEGLGTFAASAGDAILLDLLKDSWYSSRRTKTWKTAGKILGFATALFLPTAWAAGVKGTGIASKGFNFLFKYASTPGVGVRARLALSKVGSAARAAAETAGKAQVAKALFGGKLAKFAMHAAPLGVAIGPKLFAPKQPYGQYDYGQMPQMPTQNMEQPS